MSANPKIIEDAVTDAMLDAIMDAFNRNDTDAILAWFTEDGRFDTTAGPDEDGKSFHGKAAIRAAFDGLFTSVTSIRWDPIDTRVVGDKAYCELHRRATLPSGEEQSWLSLDVLTFTNGLITRKSSYAKRRT
jgi:uncharacterized protein (TIGR02246 family)